VDDPQLAVAIVFLEVRVVEAVTGWERLGPPQSKPWSGCASPLACFSRPSPSVAGLSRRALFRTGSVVQPAKPRTIASDSASQNTRHGKMFQLLMIRRLGKFLSCNIYFEAEHHAAVTIDLLENL